MTVSWVKRITIGYLILAIASLQGCYSMKPVEGIEDRNNIIEAVKPNDVIAVETRQGKEMKFKVSHIGDGRIAGEGQEVQIDDIKELKIEKLSKGKSIAAGFGVYMIIMGIAIAAMISKMFAF